MRAMKSIPCGICEIRFVAEKSECVYIGDTGGDMVTAKNAGVDAVGVLWGFRDREELAAAGADALISRASELLGIG